MNVIERIERKEIDFYLGRSYGNDVVAVDPCFKDEFLELAKLGQQMQWVKCSERLPDLDGHYLVRNNIGREISYFFKRHGSFIDNNITHWMPLPPAPKGAE